MVNGYDIWSNLGRLVQLDPAAAEALVARYNTDCAGNQENLVDSYQIFRFQMSSLLGNNK